MEVGKYYKGETSGVIIKITDKKGRFSDTVKGICIEDKYGRVGEEKGNWTKSSFKQIEYYEGFQKGDHYKNTETNDIVLVTSDSECTSKYFSAKVVKLGCEHGRLPVTVDYGANNFYKLGFEKVDFEPKLEQWAHTFTGTLNLIQKEDTTLHKVENRISEIDKTLGEMLETIDHLNTERIILQNLLK